MNEDEYHGKVILLSDEHISQPYLYLSFINLTSGANPNKQIPLTSALQTPRLRSGTQLSAPLSLYVQTETRHLQYV